MSVISITKLYELLSSKIGKENAENLTSFIEHKIKDEVENKSQLLATKDDLARVEIKLIRWMVGLWFTTILTIIGLYIKSG